ncbi:MAG: TIR domain-containing protein, partial [Clostridia bacterium]|nr:TIR domain-containing protein [Clostridia bacterium]
MSIFKCKMCGGTLEIQNNETVAVCEYCGTKQTLPRLDDEKRANLYDRANHFRRNNEFDKAAAIYEQILSEDGKDAEAYWSLVLCRYGIEYVEDPATHKRVPTVNRAQFTSIYADADYQAALEHADGYQRTVYEEEAKAIYEIQKGILAIYQKEEPFDVFICYKETDNNGRRTPDSVLANDLYHQLTQEGFKVFFARITLEDKLGSAYEPYIFAALNSAKVMVVLGTKPEYFNAVWVKNEWNRFLALTKDGKKTLIPAYKDMDPYYLPPEFASLQAQDMSKLGFMQDLIRGIKKIMGEETHTSVNFSNADSANRMPERNPLLDRAFLFVEEGNWHSAGEYCEKVLDQNPRDGEAYLCKMLIERKLSKREQLAECEHSFVNDLNFKRAKQYGSALLVAELDGYTTAIERRKEEIRKEKIYQSGIRLLNKTGTEVILSSALDTFKSISGYKDADALAVKCEQELHYIQCEKVYLNAVACAKNKNVEKQTAAIALFETIRNYKDSDARIISCNREIDKINAESEQVRYKQVLAAEEQHRAVCYREASTALKKAETEAACKEIRAVFVSLDDYKDSRDMVQLCDTKIQDLRYGPTYRQAIAYGKSKNVQQLEEAIALLETIRTYKDAEKRIDEYKTRIEE